MKHRHEQEEACTAAIHTVTEETHHPTIHLLAASPGISSRCCPRHSGSWSSSSTFSRLDPAFWGIYSNLVCTNWSKKRNPIWQCPVDRETWFWPEDTWSNLRVLSHWQFSSDPLLPSPGAAQETTPELLQPTQGALYRHKKSMKYILIW